MATLTQVLEMHDVVVTNRWASGVKVSDLIRAGEEAAPRIAEGLNDSDVQVLYICATALGVLKAEAAIPALERLVREDVDALARSQAVVALGQIESTGSLDLLREHLKNDQSRDVRHQCELKIDQIKKRMGSTEELRSHDRQGAGS